MLCCQNLCGSYLTEPYVFLICMQNSKKLRRKINFKFKQHDTCILLTVRNVIGRRRVQNFKLFIKPLTLFDFIC